MRLTLSLLLCLFVPVLMMGQDPVADFTADQTSGCGPLAVHFTDKSSGGPILYWNWDFGSAGTSIQSSPTVIFLPGTYTITLVVRNASGIGSITKTSYLVISPSPTVNFSANQTLVCLPAPVQFKDATIPNAPSISSWHWDFGDNDTSNLQNPVHVYKSAGFYSIYLAVVSSAGCRGDAYMTRYIRVVNGVKADFS